MQAEEILKTKDWKNTIIGVVQKERQLTLGIVKRKN